jgi:hypothetical protein
VSEIFLPITYDADDNPHIHQPHTTEKGATAAAIAECEANPGKWRYEVHCFDLIEDAVTTHV